MAGAVRAAIVAQKKKGWDARGRRGRSGSRRVAVDGEKRGGVKRGTIWGGRDVNKAQASPLEGEQTFAQ